MFKHLRKKGTCVMEKTYANIEVSSVNVFPRKGKGSVLATAEVTLNGMFIIHSMRVVDGIDGIYVGYPLLEESRNDGNRVACFPVSRRLREEISSMVIDEYMRVTENIRKPSDGV